ncbi:hypothetical protein UA32_12580 [Photobacterium angustum]|uniref:site-specific DNA-methyltransferase (adenine-specific) n=1 Tax=Photobacterium angustum TaxID=661 RepID=A0ABX5H1Q0_PHOAN|nr:DNA adenine methylase [Photobacterium angustum]KJG37781.1 hypothetical protein UA32_12580 [Photobacterium angustum]PSX07051.1 hypothetical protein C0W27_15900 [Photobacterium angustum]
MMSLAKIKSPLKYAGNKGFLAQRLERLIIKEVDFKNDIVQEPFAGSLGFSLYFGFKHVIANDKSLPIANFWQHIKNGHIPPQFTDLTETNYYLTREKFKILTAKAEQVTLTNEDKKELSDLMLYINYASYNGLMRVSKKSGFNVPFGRPKSTMPLSKLALCRAASSLMGQWQITNDCFSTLNYDDAKLKYFDPPYAQQYTAYAGLFNDELQSKIITLNDSSNSKIIISNSIQDRSLLKSYQDAGYSLYTTPVRRRISCKSGDRKQATELVAFRGFTTRKIASYCSDLTKIRL